MNSGHFKISYLLETFTVTLKQNKSAMSSGLVGTYNLEITPTEVRLIDIKQTKRTIVWAYQEIRKFNTSTNLFTLEVGRRSQTGEGVFNFNTNNAKELYKCIDSHIERLIRDKTIHKEVSNSVRAQPVHHIGMEGNEESTDISAAGKCHLTETDMFQKVPSIKKEESVDELRQFNDSMQTNNTSESSIELKNLWDEIDAQTNPYGVVVHHGK